MERLLEFEAKFKPALCTIVGTMRKIEPPQPRKLLNSLATAYARQLVEGYLVYEETGEEKRMSGHMCRVFSALVEAIPETPRECVDLRSDDYSVHVRYWRLASGRTLSLVIWVSKERNHVVALAVVRRWKRHG